jgi:hypothetical protein
LCSLCRIDDEKDTVVPEFFEIEGVRDLPGTELLAPGLFLLFLLFFAHSAADEVIETFLKRSTLEGDTTEFDSQIKSRFLS